MPRTILLTSVLTSLFLAGLALTPAVAATPATFGAQIDFADDFDLGIGARAAIPTDTVIDGTRLVGSFDFYFPDGPVDFWELNFNGHYLFDLPNAPVGLYAGGGIHIARASVDLGSTFGSVSDTEMGLNLLGGIDIPLEGPVDPYVELKIEVGGAEQFVLTGGLNF